MAKVIFDTNVLFDSKMNFFLKKQNELKKFNKISEILIPDMVIEELKEKYKREFETEKLKFNKALLNNIASHNINDIDIDDLIESLMEEETINYEVLELKDYSILYKMKELALKKLPPFEEKDHTDKGFKDAYIYFTVLEYFQKIDGQKIFFVTNDKLFKAAFKEIPEIIVIDSYEEFIKNNIKLLCDEYFINQLQEGVYENIKKEHVINYWININENHVFDIKTDEDEYIVEMDAGEIMDFKKYNDYSNDIKGLINSNHFDTTKICAANLSAYTNLFSDEEVIEILKAASENENIYRTISNEDVKHLISILYENKKYILLPELEISIKKILDK